MNQNAEWPDRPLVTHQGRWKRGEAAQNAYKTAVFEKADGVWLIPKTKQMPGSSMTSILTQVKNTISLQSIKMLFTA